MSLSIAIIGSGISGLSAVHRLAPQHRVTLFEAENRLGGHTATIDVEQDGRRWAIDTGFIVFNNVNYPRFKAMIEACGVDYRPTEMSFSVENRQSGLIYNGNTLATLFAQKRNLISPGFYRLLAEIVRFNRLGKRTLAEGCDDTLTLGAFLSQNGFGEAIRQNYILPMVAAIWSASLGEAAEFPLRFFLRFFENHGLLNVNDRPQWYTIDGGSKSYIPKLLDGRDPEIRLGTTIDGVQRTAHGVEIRIAGRRERFDEVIFACHSDQALALLDDASEAEREILGAIPFRNNEVVLHQDEAMLPPIRSAIASWNYHLDGQDADHPATVTYHMNTLQNLPADAPTFCVTLNDTGRINPQRIVERFNYSHPVFSREMVAAQARRDEICGQRHSHFCGAWWYNGFHEDGVRSAFDVCDRLMEAGRG